MRKILSLLLVATVILSACGKPGSPVELTDSMLDALENKQNDYQINEYIFSDYYEYDYSVGDKSYTVTLTYPANEIITYKTTGDEISDVTYTSDAEDDFSVEEIKDKVSLLTAKQIDERFIQFYTDQQANSALIEKMEFEDVNSYLSYEYENENDSNVRIEVSKDVEEITYSFNDETSSNYSVNMSINE